MRFPVALAAMAALGLFFTPVRADEKSEKLAREAVEKIFKALKAEDIDGVMKAVSFPYYDGKELIRDSAEFKKKISNFFENADFTTLTFEIKEIHEFAKIKDQIKDEDKEKVNEILKDGDMVVMTSFEKDGKASKIGWGVAIRDGKAKIVGGKPSE
ncbi:MAG: hypothetical protein EXR99_07380 [Gemmataceae bacterium]|nr:hypothetical protein [Gemmataceae bacterium]